MLDVGSALRITVRHRAKRTLRPRQVTSYGGVDDLVHVDVVVGHEETLTEHGHPCWPFGRRPV